MKKLIFLCFLFLQLAANAQYKTLVLNSGNSYRYTTLYFVSDDTLFFRSKTEKADYKVALNDLKSNFYMPVGKYYHLNSRSKNLLPLKIGIAVGLGLMVGGVATALMLDTDFVAIYAMVYAAPGGVVFSVSKFIHDNRKIHQRAKLAT